MDHLLNDYCINIDINALILIKASIQAIVFPTKIIYLSYYDKVSPFIRKKVNLMKEEYKLPNFNSNSS